MGLKVRQWYILQNSLHAYKNELISCDKRMYESEKKDIEEIEAFLCDEKHKVLALKHKEQKLCK